MKKTLWQQWVQLGTSDDTDFRLRGRIILSNQFSVFIALITTAFMVIFLLRSQFNVGTFIIMLMIAGSISVFNYLGMTRLSRLITCLTPALGFFLVNFSRKVIDPATVDILHYATPRMLILSSLVLPYTMFTQAEKSYVVGSILFIVLLTFGYDFIHQWAGVDIESLGIEAPAYSVIYEDLIVMTILIVIASSFTFRLGNRYDLHNQKILHDALRQAEQLRQNEEAMKKSLDELGEARKKDEERSWVSKGLADMISILQSGDSSEMIFDTLISSLVRFTDLNQGALFVVDTTESGEKVVRLMSCFAYNRKKYVEINLAPGQGLLGQAYLDGETTYLTEVPADHFKITSGLGEATPRHLLIVPMKINNTVEGLMEFASFAPIESRHIELFEKLGENIASFIANNRSNEQTKHLLERAQSLSAEMRENEEELRQNLEELQATQEAVARKEKEYQDRIAELEDEIRQMKSRVVMQ